jgi:hypothetical protein
MKKIGFFKRIGLGIREFFLVYGCGVKLTLLRSIARGRAGKVDGVIIDVETARAILAFHDALESKEDQLRYLAIPAPQMAEIARRTYDLD